MRSSQFWLVVPTCVPSHSASLHPCAMGTVIGIWRKNPYRLLLAYIVPILPSLLRVLPETLLLPRVNVPLLRTF